MTIDANKLENKVAWWNEISAGVGLVLGYLIYIIYLLFTPASVLEVEILEPVYEQRVIGTIPQDYVIYDNNEVSNKDNLSNKHEIVRKVPIFNKDGSPKLRPTIYKKKGRGQTKVETKRIEILIPTLSEQAYKKKKINDGFKKIMTFSPNVYLKGSGTYYEQKTITFNEGYSAETFAVRTATGFAFLSLLLFFLKSRQKVFSYLVRTFNYLFNVNERKDVYYVKDKYKELYTVAIELMGGSEELALEFIYSPIKDWLYLSPTQMVDIGQGETVIQLIKKRIDQQKKENPYNDKDVLIQRISISDNENIEQRITETFQSVVDSFEENRVKHKESYKKSNKKL